MNKSNNSFGGSRNRYQNKSRSSTSNGSRNKSRFRNNNSFKNRGSSRSRYSSKKSSIPEHKYIQKASEIQESARYEVTNNFSSLNLHAQLLRNIQSRGYKQPTKIQDQAIPEIMRGSDILGIGRTGSGKTGAFLIPMIDKVIKNNGERVLILCPTRELANQIQKEFLKFIPQIRQYMTLIIGGASMGKQISHLRNRPSFVVATPGRLLDLEDRGKIDLSNFNNIILDEVDQMLDMGFVKDIKTIISKLKPNKQSLFFSATLTQREELIANEFLKNPVKIESDAQMAHTNVEQDIVRVTSQTHKLEVLQEIIKKSEVEKVIVFSRTKRAADNISKELNKNGLYSDSLHGGKRQNVRDRVLTKFRQNKISILIATDVAARGIDIPNVTHVINYDEPETYNDYIHRIGRTGRIGNKGTALTFVLS